MKHGCERVIIGFAAMQGYSYFKSQSSGKSRRDPKLFGKHPTSQNNQRIYSLRKLHKTVCRVYRISVCRFGQIQSVENRSFFTCTSQIPLFFYSMSHFASQQLNLHLHCNQMMFIYTVFSRLYLISFFYLGTKISQNALHVTASFLTK